MKGNEVRASYCTSSHHVYPAFLLMFSFFSNQKTDYSVLTFWLKRGWDSVLPGMAMPLGWQGHCWHWASLMWLLWQKAAFKIENLVTIKEEALLIKKHMNHNGKKEKKHGRNLVLRVATWTQNPRQWYLKYFQIFSVRKHLRAYVVTAFVKELVIAYKLFLWGPGRSNWTVGVTWFYWTRLCAEQFATKTLPVTVTAGNYDFRQNHEEEKIQKYTGEGPNYASTKVSKILS